MLLKRDGVFFFSRSCFLLSFPEDVRIKLCRRRFWSVVFFLAGRENASNNNQGASLPNDGRLGHLLLHMQLETRALGVLVGSYCYSTYRVADPFSSLGTFSSSSIGGPVFHPIDDCEHPLLYLLDTGVASQETAISGSFQQNLAGICNSVCIGG